MLGSGTFNVARDLWEHDAFAEDVFSEREAWLWMVREAAFKGHTRKVIKGRMPLERGQLPASLNGFAARWRWSRTAVKRFLDKLEAHEMIRRERGTSGTVVSRLTICNYDDYQGGRKKSGTVAEQSAEQSRNSGPRGGGTVSDQLDLGFQEGNPAPEEDGGTVGGTVAPEERNSERHIRSKESMIPESRESGGGGGPPALERPSAKIVALHPMIAPELRDLFVAAAGGKPGKRGRLGDDSDRRLAQTWVDAIGSEAECLRIVMEHRPARAPSSLAYFAPIFERILAAPPPERLEPRASAPSEEARPRPTPRRRPSREDTGVDAYLAERRKTR